MKTNRKTSLIFRHASAMLTQLLAVLSLLYLFRGHHAPGGGFVAGLILSSAVVLRAISHGPQQAHELIGVDPRTLVGVGLAVALSAALAGLVVEGTLLAPLELTHAPSLGTIGSVLVFDIGVYILVAGTALTILLVMIEEEP